MKTKPEPVALEDLDFQILDAVKASSKYAHLRGEDFLEPLSKRELRLSWICRGVAAAIMLETLFFKFTGAPESIYIFSKMAMESWGRYGQGVWELTAAILLLTPGTAWLGGLLTLGAMGAAIMSHLTVLGVSVQNDHGLLFGMALTAFTGAFIVTWIHQREIPDITRLDD